MKNGKVRVGLVGAGFIAPLHCAGYLQSPSAELEVVYSRSAERAKALAERFGFRRWTTDWQEVTASDDVDLVDVIVPNLLHHPVTMDAIRHGKHVIVEKPLARTLAEADEMIAAADTAGVKLMYAENLRFAPDLLRSKEILESHALGRPFLIRTTEMHSGPHGAWFWDAELTGGGAVMDMGVHGLFALEWVMDEPATELFAWTDTLVHHDRCKNGAEDTSLVSVRFASGALGEMVNSWAVQGGVDVRTEIFGTDGTLLLDHGHGSPIRVFSRVGFGEAVEKAGISTGWSFPSVLEGLRGGHIPEITHFVDCVVKDQPPALTGRDGRRVLELVFAAYESSRTRRPVAVDPSPVAAGR